tara:strand:+ start:3689 stop:4618 length:930 start_codon:yes stop_codon:yes gene_type:complete
MNRNNFKIISFYKFIKIKNPDDIKYSLDDYIKGKKLRGTILLANEGINASISGNELDLKKIVKKINILLNNKVLNIKTNSIDFLPFNKMKVRLKNEIVSLGKKNIDVPKYTGKLIAPKYWNELIKQKNIKLIDTRNEYEYKIGHFKNAINPQTKSFRDFPNKIDRLGIKKNDNIVMYCTGGIRCEKLSAFLAIKGYQNVMQLEGGIINFLKFTKKTRNSYTWSGECFVFDNRVTVNKNLEKGNYEQCHGCRHPITKSEKQLTSYKKGVSCKYCINERSNEQKQNSEVRQNQINIAEAKNTSHPFKKIID